MQLGRLYMIGAVILALALISIPVIPTLMDQVSKSELVYDIDIELDSEQISLNEIEKENQLPVLFYSILSISIPSYKVKSSISHHNAFNWDSPIRQIQLPPPVIA
ncbi:hypothetical protein [Nonlabens sp. SY33080]|uniref:hypothetical protein n=1 Tax=unclassified Nonlabens TaxID=2615035 RepID=UPI001428B14E|nr:hypothetical protein [Nonlabens sp. SY33080]